MESIIFLFAASLIAGIVNGVAGGGGLIAFPALLIAGVPAVNANATNAAAIVHFTFAHKIIWLETIVMASGAIIGAYTSASLARKLNPLWIRNFIISIGLSMTCYFFIQ